MLFVVLFLFLDNHFNSSGCIEVNKQLTCFFAVQNISEASCFRLYNRFTKWNVSMFQINVCQITHEYMVHDTFRSSIFDWEKYRGKGKKKSSWIIQIRRASANMEKIWRIWMKLICVDHLILAGVYRPRGEAKYSLWDAESKRAVFHATMPQKTNIFCELAIGTQDKQGLYGQVCSHQRVLGQLNIFHTSTALGLKSQYMSSWFLNRS